VSVRRRVVTSVAEPHKGRNSLMPRLRRGMERSQAALHIPPATLVGDTGPMPPADR
jgi:hypothetical protein